MFVFTAALPIGFFLTSLRLIQDIFKSAQGSLTNLWRMEEKTMNELKEQQSKTDS
jgi:TRAP-type C4-dicarboxylate transport system permease small subunit